MKTKLIVTVNTEALAVIVNDLLTKHGMGSPYVNDIKAYVREDKMAYFRWANGSHYGINYKVNGFSTGYTVLDAATQMGELVDLLDGKSAIKGWRPIALLPKDGYSTIIVTSDPTQAVERCSLVKVAVNFSGRVDVCNPDSVIPTHFMELP